MAVNNFPSVKQMLNRANDGHRTLLEVIEEDSTVPGASTLTAGQLRGYRTCLSTLRAWGCVEDDKLTDRGVELLAALRVRKRRAGW